MLEPPDRTMCLYSSLRMSRAAVWIVWKSISSKSADQGLGRDEQNKELTCYARLFDVHEMRLEHAFRCFKLFRSDFDGVPIQELGWGGVGDQGVHPKQSPHTV